MGTRFEVAIVTDGLPRAEVAALGEKAIQEIEDWHRRLTRFESDSWLSHVNRTAAREPVKLDDEMFPLFDDAVSVWRKSGGAFDITKGQGASLALDSDTRTIRFDHEGVSLDVGAIGKGHALDAAAAILRSHGVTSAFLQGGTSSGIAVGRPPHSDGWRIGISPEPLAEAPMGIIELSDAAFSLSDEAGQPLAPLGRHIVDPRPEAAPTAARPPRRVLVTGPSARLADAWSTALAVLGDVPPEFPAAYTARFLRQ
jgi:thiamine biosynthesis lipoprotein